MSLVQNGHRLLMVFIGACILFIILQLNSLQIQNSLQPFVDNSSSHTFSIGKFFCFRLSSFYHFLMFIFIFMVLESNTTTNISQILTNVSGDRKFVVDVKRQLQSQPMSSSSLSSSSFHSKSSSSKPSFLLSPSSFSSPPSSTSSTRSRPFSKPSPKIIHLRSHGSNKHFWNPILKLPIYNGPTNVSRVLLVTYFRSGSSYLGDIMQQNWKTFYTFEPLIFLTLGYKINQTMTERGLDVIKKVFECDFEKIDLEYIKYFAKNNFLMTWNKFLNSVCHNNSTTCSTRRFMSETCRRSRYNLIKSTRLTMDHVEILWKQLKTQNFHVVFFVRDPRGIWNSRLTRDFCIESKGCTSIELICNEMRDDLKKYEELKSIMKDKLILFKYEDITSVESQRDTVKALMKNVSLPYGSAVARFVKTHSFASVNHTKINDPYSTFRVNSTITANQWMQQLTKQQIIQAQTVCEDVLKKLNYPFV